MKAIRTTNSVLPSPPPSYPRLFNATVPFIEDFSLFCAGIGVDRE